MNVEVITHADFLEYVVEQPSEEWWALKKGIPSASGFSKIITPVTGLRSGQADGYINQLIGERSSLIPPEFIEHFTNRATRWGEQTEQEARDWYAMETGLPVRRVGWLTTLDGRCGCSPDALVGETGGLELKCPQPKTYIAYVRNPSKLLKEYKCQVHGALHVTKRLWWDLVAYCPMEDVPIGIRIRVQPDEFTIKLGMALDAFYPLYDAALARVRSA